MNKENPDQQVQAAMDLFRDVSDTTQDVELGDSICSLMDEILGRNAEQVGMLNSPNAMDALEQMTEALREVILIDGLNVSKRKKFESYISMVEERMHRNRIASENNERIASGISSTRGGFSGFNNEDESSIG